jgi:hypothetical protein
MWLAEQRRSVDWYGEVRSLGYEHDVIPDVDTIVELWDASEIETSIFLDRLLGTEVDST